MKTRMWMVLFLLLLLNLIVLAWQWDVLAHWGWAPPVQREPARLQQQIRPEALTFTLPGQAAAAPAALSQAPARSDSPDVAASETPPTDSPAVPASAAPTASQATPVSTAPTQAVLP